METLLFVMLAMPLEHPSTYEISIGLESQFHGLDLEDQVWVLSDTKKRRPLDED